MGFDVEGIKARLASEFFHELLWFLVVLVLAVFFLNLKLLNGDLCQKACVMSAELNGSKYAGFNCGWFGECTCSYYPGNGITAGPAIDWFNALNKT